MKYSVACHFHSIEIQKFQSQSHRIHHKSIKSGILEIIRDFQNIKFSIFYFVQLCFVIVSVNQIVFDLAKRDF